MTATTPPARALGYLGVIECYVLACGHTVPSNLPLDDALCVRCLKCYREQMRTAERLLER